MPTSQEFGKIHILFYSNGNGGGGGGLVICNLPPIAEPSEF